MIWVIIIIAGIVIYILTRFSNDSKNVQSRNIYLGGMKKLFPEFVNYYEKNGFELVEDSGTNLVYKKALINNQRSNKFLFLAVESKFANIMYGYIITKDGSKVKSANVPFSKNYKQEDVEIIIRMITDEFHVMGHLTQLPNIEEPPVKEEKDLTKLYDFLNELVDNADQKGNSDMKPIDKMYFSLVEREKQVENKKNLELFDLYTKQIENNSQNKVAYYNRGAIKMVLEDYLGAISDYRKAIEIDSDYSDAIEGLSTAIEYEEFKKEVEAFKLDIENDNKKRLTSKSNIAVENNVETVTDIDGNVYKTVRIGNQVWMAENLRVSRYRNGDVIPNIDGNTEWFELKSGGCCDNDNNKSNGIKFGKLYNWYAVDDKRSIAPEGWHIPCDSEWSVLENYLIVNGYNYDGTKFGNRNTNNKIAKSLASTSHWKLHKCEGAIGNDLSINNKTCFNALPSGTRYGYGTFSFTGDFAYWWSSTEFDDNSAWNRYLSYLYSEAIKVKDDKSFGFSVRCIKD